MPIDPNISLAVTPARGVNILEPYMQAQELQKNALQLGSLALQNQQQRMDFQDQMTTRQMLPGLIQEHGGDWEKAFSDPRLLSSVSPKTAFSFQQLALERKLKTAQFQEATSKTGLTDAQTAEIHRDFLGDAGVALLRGAGGDASKITPAALEGGLTLLAHHDPNNAPLIMQARDTLLANPSQIGPEVTSWIYASPKATENWNRYLAEQRAQTKAGQETQEFQAKLPGLEAESATKRGAQAAQELSRIVDPDTGVPKKDDYDAWALKFRDQKPPAVPTAANIASFMRGTVPIKEQPEYDINVYKRQAGMLGNSEFDQFLAQYARSLGKTPATLLPGEFFQGMQKYAETKQDPVMRANAIAMKALAESNLRLQMNMAPTQEDIEVQAKALLNHTMSPTQFAELKGRGASIAGKVFTLASKLDPNFSLARAENEFKAMEKTEQAFTSGTKADLVRSNNNAIEHSGMLLDAVDALENNRLPVLNRIAQYFGVATGNDTKTVFDHIATRVGDEVTKAFIPGGGGQAERVGAAGSYNSAMSPQQLRSNIRADIRLMDSQQRNLEDQYKRGTYGQGQQTLFTDEALQTRNRILGATGGRPAPTGGATGVQPAPTAQPRTPTQPTRSFVPGKINVKDDEGFYHPFDTEQEAQRFEGLVKKVGGKTTRVNR